MHVRVPRLSKKWMIFTVTANGTFMSTLSAGIVNIALPTMSVQFGVTLESIQLVVSMYLLVLTCLLPVFREIKVPAYNSLHSGNMVKGFTIINYHTKGTGMTTGDTIPAWPFVLGGVGVLSLIAALVLNRKRKGRKA